MTGPTARQLPDHVGLHPVPGYRLNVIGMDTRRRDDAPETVWAGVDACTLPTAERPLRLAEFDDLFATSLRAVERMSATQAHLLLEGGPGVAERTQALADAESSCCAFFTFGVTETPGGVVAFDIEVPTAYAEVLAGLVVRAEGALSEAS